MPKLTKELIDKKIEIPEKGQKIYWCSEQPGFGLRVTAGGARTYVVQQRVNGKTVRVKIGRHGVFTPESARIEAKKLLGDTARGIDPNAQKKVEKVQATTLADVFKAYLKDRQLRPRSIQIYSDALTRCLSDWQDVPVSRITRDMVEKRLTEISEGHNHTGGSKAQAGQCYRLLRSLIRYANDKYEANGKTIITADPTRNLSKNRPWTKSVRRQSVIQSHELAKWFEAVLSIENNQMQQTMRDYLIVCLLTGLRKQEAAKLKWSNIDRHGKYLKIESADTKNHEEHRLPLSDYIYTLLMRRLSEAELSSIYVFPGAKPGTHIVEVKRAIKKVTKASGVKFMLHDLRRTFITIAEAVDVQHYTLKRLVNHKTSGDVTGGYIVTEVERMRQPMQRITDYILEKAGIDKAIKIQQAQ